MNINHSNNFTKKEQIDVMSENEIINLAKIRYTKLRDVNLQAELCYYSSKESNLLIPSYIIKGSNNNTSLLEMVLPANQNYIPTIKINDGIPIDIDNNITYPLGQNLKADILKYKLLLTAIKDALVCSRVVHK